MVRQDGESRYAWVYCPFISGLTPSERCIVAQLLDGLSGAELAAQRGRSYRTIANQLATIYRKCGVNSRQELVAHVTASP